MNWIKCGDRVPVDNFPKIVFCQPAKGYKHQERDSIFMAKYCACSGWTEVVSNPEMDGQQRRYWDHFVKYDITHWSEYEEPLI